MATSIVNTARQLASTTPPATPAKSFTTQTTQVKLGSGALADESPQSSGARMRSVGELRPKAGVVVTPAMSVAQAAQVLAAARQDACLVLSSAVAGAEDASLEGILTDVDVVRKVLSLGLEPDAVLVRDVMTKSPICVREETATDDALSTMLSKHCRHLPVIGAAGSVVGLLDISKLLFDVMQTCQGRAGAQRNLFELFGDAQVMRLGGGAGSGAAPTHRVMQAALLMAERRSALIVSSSADRKTVDGILTPKDLLFRAVARSLPTTSTTVAEVMTSAPDVIPGSATVLQALHQLSTGGYRSVPVVDEAGAVLGVLDVLGLVAAALNSAEPPPPVAEASDASRLLARMNLPLPSRDQAALAASMTLTGALTATATWKAFDSLPASAATLKAMLAAAAASITGMLMDAMAMLMAPARRLRIKMWLRSM